MKKIVTCLFLSVMAFGLIACSDEQQSTPKQEDVPVYKELTDPRGNTLESTATGELNPHMVETLYATEDVVIADLVPTEMGYAVDPTGLTDSTAGIQQALLDCHYAGGGTVYLPAGNYAISDSIEIPEFVTLRGDWQDPDEGTEYGTIISVWMESYDSETTGVFIMKGSSGAVGLTVYYPLQTLDCIKPYPFTFYKEGGLVNRMLASVENVTFINAYRGIGTTYMERHEMVEIKNVKGTYLNCGAGLYNAADVTTVTNYVVSNKYWKEAAADCMNAAEGKKLDAYTQKYTTGLKIAALEWCTYQNVSIDGCKTGIHFTEGVRVQNSGELYDIDVTNCKHGIVVDGARENFGILIAKSHVDGGIVNNTKAPLKLCDVDVKGEIVDAKGDTIMIDETDLSDYAIDYDQSYTKPKENVVIAELLNGIFVDHSIELQKFLDEVAADGGGVVYVPGGTYRFKSPISVPAGVELRGNSSVMTRDQRAADGGTIFLCYYGDGATDGIDSQAFITLDGENAGINGIRIVYPENGPHDADLSSTYTIRGTAKGVYAVNVMISASAYGIDFMDCDNHYISGVITGCYYNAFRLGGKDGVMTRCLQNGTVLARTQTGNLVDWIVEADLFDVLFNPVLREKAEYIIVENGTNQLIYNVFSYGCKTGVVHKESKDTTIINIGQDNQGAFAPQFDIKSGTLTIVNALRYQGYSCELESGEVAMYNRSAHGEIGEKTLIKKK